MDAFGWPHLLIILAVIILLFGAAKLPGVAKALGQSMRVFKSEMAKAKAEDAASAVPPTPTGAAVPAPAPPQDPAGTRQQAVVERSDADRP